MTDRAKIKDREKLLVRLTSEFCDLFLNEEHKELTKKLIRKLGSRQNVIFGSGNLYNWATAIIQTIGSINFLFDSSFDPYVSLGELNDHFGTDQSTVSDMKEEIRKQLNLDFLDDEFSIHQLPENNQLSNQVMVDGFFIPLESLPHELREKVREARSQGLDVQFSSEVE